MFGPSSPVRRTAQAEFERYKDVSGTLYYIETLSDEWYESWAAVHHEDGRIERFVIDFTRFLPMTKGIFNMWVDLGMPSRYDIKTNGPMYPEDIEIAWTERCQ